MKMISFALVLFSSVSYADKLSIGVQAKGISVKGTFAFKPGSTVKISGTDSLGKVYDLEVISKVQKDSSILLICKVDHSGKKEDVSVMTTKNMPASVSTSTQGHQPDLQFDANWTE